MPPHTRHYSTSDGWHHGTRAWVCLLLPGRRNAELGGSDALRRVIVRPSVRESLLGATYPAGAASRPSSTSRNRVASLDSLSSNRSRPAAFPDSCWWTRRNWSYTLTLSFTICTYKYYTFLTFSGVFLGGPRFCSDGHQHSLHFLSSSNQFPQSDLWPLTSTVTHTAAAYRIFSAFGDNSLEMSEFVFAVGELWCV